MYVATKLLLLISMLNIRIEIRTI